MDIHKRDSLSDNARCFQRETRQRQSHTTGPWRAPGLAALETFRDLTAARLQAPSGCVVTLGLLVFAAVWLFHLASTSLSPPVDNIEQLTWVRSLQWGYYKHPPLPTWLLWGPVQLLGLSPWTGSLLGSVVTLGAMGIFWRLMEKLRGATYAALALLAVLCMTYYNGRLNYYNHNVVLLLAVVASAWCCWHAFDERRLRWCVSAAQKEAHVDRVLAALERTARPVGQRVRGPRG